MYTYIPISLCLKPHIVQISIFFSGHFTKQLICTPFGYKLCTRALCKPNYTRVSSSAESKRGRALVGLFARTADGKTTQRISFRGSRSTGSFICITKNAGRHDGGGGGGNRDVDFDWAKSAF